MHPTISKNTPSLEPESVYPPDAEALADDVVIIVGGGAAGVYAAVELNKLGYTPMILEADSAIGGKCQSVELPQVDFQGSAQSNQRTGNYDHGAILVTLSHKRVRRLIKEAKFHVASVPELYFSNNTTFPQRIQRDLSVLPFLLSCCRYILLAWKYDAINRNPATISKFPELQTSVADFLQKNQLSSIKILFDVALSANGYGTLDTIPAHHAFAVIPYQELMLIPFLPHSLILEGYQKLLQETVKRSNVVVNINAKVQKVEVVQHSGSHRIYVDLGDRIYLAKHVILTTPLSHISIRYPQHEENILIEELQQPVERSPYNTLIFNSATPLPYGVIVNTNFDDTEACIIVQKFQDRQTYISYSYGDNATQDQEAQKLFRFLAKTFGIEEQEVTIKSFRTFPAYYLRPSLKNIRNGYYEKITSLQGRYGIYFAGSSSISFESVERAMESSEYIVRRHFEKRRAI